MEAKIGDEVRAFDPRTLGVIKVGTVEKIGSKYATVHFGLTGSARVPLRDITEIVRTANRTAEFWTD